MFPLVFKVTPKKQVNASIKIRYKNTPFKGTVSVISDDPPYKDGNVRFTTVPLKYQSNYKCENTVGFDSKKLNFDTFSIVFNKKFTFAMSLQMKK